jgi:hypothetical protein
MRLRFSLRTLFLLTTVVAGVCLWFMLPTITARRFVHAVAKEDYKSADSCFLYDDDQFLVARSNKHWGFRSSAELLPFTFDQLLNNRRDVRIGVTYFAFDQNFREEIRAAATPFDLKKPLYSTAQRVGILYDGRSSSVPRN